MHRPQIVDWKGGLETLKYMLEAREYFDQEIWWEPRNGHASTCYDNWSKTGALFYVLPISKVRQ